MKVALRRMGEPDEATTAVLLAFPASSYMAGEIVFVDRGPC